MRRLISMAVLAACVQPTEGADLPGQAPPPALTLSAIGTPTPGAPFGLDVVGAAPGASIVLLAGRGAEGTDVGPCPPVLGGLCVDFLPGQPAYAVVATGTANPSGHYSWSTTVPGTIPGGTWKFQAFATSPAPAESNVVRAAAGCVDDAAEPDDSRAAAGALGGSVTGRALCPRDQDWLAIDVGPYEAVALEVDFAAADGDLDVELETAGGVLLDGSYTLSSPEEVLWFNNSAAAVTVYAQLYAVSDPQQDGIDYDLTLTRLAPAPCAGDARDPADDAATGATLLSGAGTTSGRVACLGDSDWYAVDVLPLANLRATVTEASGDGDASVVLYDAALNPVAGPGDPAYFVSPSGGRYYVEVVLDADDIAGGGAAYDLVVDLTQDRTCAADPAEPNDSAATAEPISTGVALTGFDSCTDEDWYSFPVVAGQDIVVDLFFPVSDGDIDAELYNPALQQIARGTSGADNENFYATATASGTYFLKVYLYGDYGSPVLGGAAYDMTVSLQ